MKIKVILDLIKENRKLQEENLNLIASENYPSLNVIKALNSILATKYAEGYKNNRYYEGCQFISQIEEIAKNEAKKLFNCKYANVQPHSGSDANLAVLTSILKFNDKIMSLNLNDGGHLSHGGLKNNLINRLFQYIPYFLDKNEKLDYQEIEKIALREKPNLIICGFSSYSLKFSFKKFKKIAEKVNALLLGDIAHISGIIAAKLHPLPFPFCDIVTSTMQKTIRGPKGGLILTNNFELYKKINKGVFPGIQGGPMCNNIAAKAITFIEASQLKFRKYQKNLLKNNKLLCTLLQKKNHKIVSGGTENHLFILKTNPYNISGKEAAKLLAQIGILVNKNPIPNDTRNVIETSGIRIGTAAITSRNISEREIKIIAEVIDDTLKNKLKNKILNKKKILTISKNFPIKSFRN